MTVYADWIPEEDTGNILPEPTISGASAGRRKVVNLFGP